MLSGDFKMKKIFLVWTITLLLLLSGCVTPMTGAPKADKELDNQAKTFLPKANLSNVYIYRDSISDPMGFKVKLNEHFIGEMDNGTFFLLEVPPGKYSLSSYGLNNNGVTKTLSGKTVMVKTAPGKNYFFRQDGLTSIWRNGKEDTPDETSLNQVDEKSGRDVVSHLSMIYVPENVIQLIVDDMKESQQAVAPTPIKSDTPKVAKPTIAPTERLVLMPLRVGVEDKGLQGAMETALVQGLQQNYIVFSGEQVAQKAHEIFLKESRNTAKKDCDETRCMQGIAEAFQAELIATANVTKQDGGYFLALSIQNIFDNKVVYSNSVPCKNCDSFQVVDKLKELAVH
jgi:Protein of unknown function (DUF2846)